MRVERLRLFVRCMNKNAVSAAASSRGCVHSLTGFMCANVRLGWSHNFTTLLIGC